MAERRDQFPLSPKMKIFIVGGLLLFNIWFGTTVIELVRKGQEDQFEAGRNYEIHRLGTALARDAERCWGLVKEDRSPIYPVITFGWGDELEVQCYYIIDKRTVRPIRLNPVTALPVDRPNQ